jgi:hypothetical protein
VGADPRPDSCQARAADWHHSGQVSTVLKATVEPPDTIWTMHHFEDMLFDINGNLFQPKAGVENTVHNTRDTIMLKLHGGARSTSENALDRLAAEDLKHTTGKNNAQEVEMQWCKTHEGG